MSQELNISQGWDAHSTPPQQQRSCRAGLWRTAETKLLIELLEKNKKWLASMKRNNRVWEAISQEMRAHGFHRTPLQCRNRRKVLFRELKEYSENPAKQGKSDYFDEIHRIMLNTNEESTENTTSPTTSRNLSVSVEPQSGISSSSRNKIAIQNLIQPNAFVEDKQEGKRRLFDKENDIMCDKDAFIEDKQDGKRRLFENDSDSMCDKVDGQPSVRGIEGVPLQTKKADKEENTLRWVSVLKFPVGNISTTEQPREQSLPIKINIQNEEGKDVFNVSNPWNPISMFSPKQMCRTVSDNVLSSPSPVETPILTPNTGSTSLLPPFESRSPTHDLSDPTNLAIPKVSMEIVDSLGESFKTSMDISGSSETIQTGVLEYIKERDVFLDHRNEMIKVNEAHSKENQFQVIATRLDKICQIIGKGVDETT